MALAGGLAVDRVESMISAVHALMYSDDAPATRAFFRDVLQLPFVSDDENEGPDWLIFDAGPCEIAMHPTTGQHSGEAFRAPRHHQLSLMVEDAEATAATLRERGASILTGPLDMGFGIGMEVEVPGTDAILIYQPKHATAYAR